MKLEDILKRALDLMHGDIDKTVTLLRSWSKQDSETRAVVEEFAWELVKGYLIDLHSNAEAPVE